MTSLAGLLARRFIARPDVYAEQTGSGIYHPVNKPFTKDLLDRHITGEISLGHYLVNQQGEAKLFAFDFDFVDAPRTWLKYPSGEEVHYLDEAFVRKVITLDEYTKAYNEMSAQEVGNPKELWQDKKHPSRQFYLIQMRTIVEMFTHRIHDVLGENVPIAASYSGFKGCHVMGWTGMAPAADLRALATAVIESFDRFKPTKKDQYWEDQDRDPHTGVASFQIEVFPKQDTIREGGYGNLMRLPLGKNRKAPSSRSFFIDQRKGSSLVAPRKDPEVLLESGNPWA